MSDNEQSDVLEGLEERLQNHAKAFESLLALTPAREYYGSHFVDGQDPSEQWNRKKQTKEQKAAAKKAKLDPANNKSALDVMKERELKRKRELGMTDDDDGQSGKVDAAESAGPSAKKVKAVKTPEEDEEIRKRKADAKKERRQRKQEKSAKKKEKAEAKKAAKQDRDLDEAAAEKQRASKAGDEENDDEDDEDEAAEQIGHGELGQVDFSGLVASDDDTGDRQSEASSVPSSTVNDSPAFDISANHSTASSSSSIVPPTEPPKPDTTQNKSAKKDKPSASTTSTSATSKQQPLPTFQPLTNGQASDPSPAEAQSATSRTSSPKPNLPKIDSEALQARLKARIEELRARRKADGPNGQPAKSRQELLEQRRKKEEQRKATKKELRRKQKEEEQRKQEERLRGSGSPLATPDIFSPPASRANENFSFGRIGFDDGTAADANSTGLQDARRKKGPQDAKTALLAQQNKEKRLSGYDAEKRADIAEKDLWLNAKKRAHGERVRDDTSLLKKALKRKEKEKGKSEREWKEREEAVVKGKEMKQKRRETNLAKRKEEKGGGGKKSGGKGKGKGASGGKKSKGRPGFEGRFKA